MAPVAETDHDRLALYTARYFARHRRERWPTVRQAARSLRWTIPRTIGAVAGDPHDRMYETSYYTYPEPPLGEHYIELWEIGANQ
jgi:hypothetical protein